MSYISARLIGTMFAALAMMRASAAEPDASSWMSWGNGPRVDNYSTADQINKSNVATLHPVWSYELPQRGGWELTPIVADGRLYGQDLQGNAFALDPETGKQLWRFTSGVRAGNRAVSYWPGDSGHKPRVIVAVTDRIYALDAATGLPVEGFGGTRGYVNIREGFADADPSYRMTSPPTIYRNLVITGVSTQEFGSKGPPADPRAYDAITGKLVWRFNIVPRSGEANFGTWGPDGWQGRSGPSTWGIMTVDEETGMVFIPVGQPADNYVGIDRPGNNLYSDSVLALDAATGKYRWHFQMVHHDLFDYDLSAPPALVDLNVEGQRVPALVEVTKQGFMFILDRRTGKPVFGVEERPVPRSTIPGEQNSLTQPWPLKPQPLSKQGVSRADISTITPEVNRYCTDQWNRMGVKDSPFFTPPSLHGPNMFTPTNAGGLGGVWGGVSIDRKTGYIFVNNSNMAAYNYVVPDDGKSTSRGPATGGYLTVSAFTKWMDQNGLPCIQPPWGEMMAIDGNSGDIAWRVPLGKAEVYRELGEHTGMINYAGSLVTAGGLLFIGGTTMSCSQCKTDEPVVRALDTRTGLELWRARLSAGTKSNLMTYMGKGGRQYVVATSSGRPDTDIAMVAFALSKPGDQPVNIHSAPLPPSALGRASPGSNAGVARVEDLPAGPGKDDIAKNCTLCHAISAVTATPRTLDGWNTSIEDMRTRGAKLDDAVAKRIATYLANHFSPKSPGAATVARPENE